MGPSGILLWFRRAFFFPLLDFLFPPLCVLCNRPPLEYPLCERCRRALEVLRLKPPLCRLCGGPLEGYRCPRCARLGKVFLDRGASVFRYAGTAREAIEQLKYGRVTDLAPVLGEYLAQGLTQLPQADLLIPVPLHPARIRERGFSQTLLLAREVGKITGIPVDNRSLVRTRHTRSQMGLSREARLTNLRGAFRAQGSHLRGIRVVLLDDVITTGSTMNECARALKKAGVQAVYGLSLASA